MLEANVIRPSLCWDPVRGRARYDAAQAGLRALVHRFPNHEKPVLRVSPAVNAVWLENAVLESLLCVRDAPEVALGTHELFFVFQREDGLFPAIVGEKERDGPAVARSYGWIQQNVPIARTSWEVAKATGNEAFLAAAYEACARFDAWAVRYRNTRGTGLVEMFCEYDMGLDNSPRCAMAGMPRACPDGEASRCPACENLPVLAPDLSAILYGTRCALAEMAEGLGKSAEARIWEERAGELGSLIVKHCQDPDDGFFYDVDPRGRFLHFRGTQLFPVAQEHVLASPEFELIWCRYLRNPHEYWTPYPFASHSVSDPAFDRKYLGNSWGGPANCNIALRTLLWMEHYGKGAELKTLMERWVSIDLNYGFYWQINPWTGDPSMNAGDIGLFTGNRPIENLSVCYLLYVEFTRRLGLIG